MNFWEARQAALEGKKVRRILTQKVYSPDQFLNPDSPWYNVHFEEEWEIVEEPKTIKQFINVYLDNDDEWVLHSDKKSADSAAYKDRASCIELVVAKSGKLISARNV